MPFDYFERLERPARGGRPTGARDRQVPRRTVSPTTGVAAPTGGTAPRTPDVAATNPELQGMNQSPFQGFMGGLGRGIELDAGRTGAEEQNIFNRMRERIQRMGKLGETQFTRGMGGAGFREGESGIVGRGLRDIRTGTQERLAGAARDVAISGAEKRFGEKATQAQLNLTRMLGGAQIGMQSEQQAMQNLLSMYGLMTGSQAQRWQPYWGGMAGVATGG